MKNLELYEWIAGTMSDFTKPFQENEALYNQAKGFWSYLDGLTAITIAIFIVLGVVGAVCYYGPFNQMPGRHYKPRYWLVFLVGVFVLTLALTWGFECIAAKPTLKGSGMLECRIALGNAIYASLLYFITSVVWCNILPTNAYRIFKIG